MRYLIITIWLSMQQKPTEPTPLQSKMIQDALALHQSGQLDAAETHYRNLLNFLPSNITLLTNLGTIALQKGNFEGAVIIIGKSLQINPNQPNALCNRGNALQDLNRLDEALASYDRAISLKSDYVDAYFNRGNALQLLKRFDEALASYDNAIAHKPHYVEAYYFRGHALYALKRLDEALVSYDHAVALKPDYAEVYMNRGITLQDLKRLDEALVSYDCGIALKSDDSCARWNRCLLKLLNGEYTEGWRQYEWRWKNFSNKKPLTTSKPIWTPGQPKRVLVWAEQGIGEEIMFSSLLTEFKELCSQLLVKVDTRLIPLLSRSLAKEITFIPRDKNINEDEYDEHISMGSLCQYLRNDEERFKKTRYGWLVDDKIKTDAIKKLLLCYGNNTEHHKKICGISWRSKCKTTGANRSLELKSFIEMLGLESYTYVNLQYGDTAEEINLCRTELNVNIFSYEKVDNFTDIDGLASLIQACDVIVSVDNTTVHLAGALGKDVRILLPYAADWRWQLNREDSPWYASVKLYRQHSDYQWAPIFDQVRTDLMCNE